MCWGKHDGTLSKVAAISQSCQLCPIAKYPAYHGILLCFDSQGDAKYIRLLGASSFSPKWPPYPKMSTLSNFNENLRTWGNLMGRTWWCYRNSFQSNHLFLCPHIPANDSILLYYGSQVSDSGSWEPLVGDRVL